MRTSFGIAEVFVEVRNWGQARGDEVEWRVPRLEVSGRGGLRRRVLVGGWA